MLVVIGAAGAFVASMKLTGISCRPGLLFRNSGPFFPLVLGVWWKRANRAGAIAGMIGGMSCRRCIWGSSVKWLHGLALTVCTGMICMLVSLVLMIVVSLMTEEPDAETQEMVEEIRVPSERLSCNSDLFAKNWPICLYS